MHITAMGWQVVGGDSSRTYSKGWPQILHEIQVQIDRFNLIWILKSFSKRVSDWIIFLRIGNARFSAPSHQHQPRFKILSIEQFVFVSVPHSHTKPGHQPELTETWIGDPLNSSTQTLHHVMCGVLWGHSQRCKRFLGRLFKF